MLAIAPLDYTVVLLVVIIPPRRLPWAVFLWRVKGRKGFGERAGPRGERTAIRTGDSPCRKLNLPPLRRRFRIPYNR